MNHRLATTITYASTVAVSALAAALMTGHARAEGPIEVLPPFTSTLSRAQVQDDVLSHRDQVTSFASEYVMQRNGVARPASSFTRQQARADYIASREQVRAMTGEDSGSSYLTSHPQRAPMLAMTRSDSAE